MASNAFFVVVFCTVNMVIEVFLDQYLLNIFLAKLMEVILAAAAPVLITALVMIWQSKIAPKPKVVIHVGEFQELHDPDDNPQLRRGLMVTVTNRGQLSTTIRYISIISYKSRLAKFRKENFSASLPWDHQCRQSTKELPILLQPGDYWSCEIYIDWLLEKAPGHPIYVFADHTFSDRPKAVRVVHELFK